MSAQAGEGRGLLERLLSGRDLDEGEASLLLEVLTSEATHDAMRAGLLIALRQKGETGAELRGMARAMKRLALAVTAPARVVIDTCGTGGDGAGLVNLSTGTAVLGASLGLCIAKHGNRAVSGRSGSLDAVGALGLPVPAGAAEAERSLAEHGFAFLLAPTFHVATSRVAEVRRALGVRTVFNMLGPLSNPASPTHQLTGAFDLRAARLMAEALSGLGVERAFVVHGDGGVDEATPSGPFELFDVRPGRVEARRVDPESYGVARCELSQLVAPGPRESAAMLRAALSGERGPVRDALVLNGALLLELVGRGEGRAAAGMAADEIDSGRAAATLRRLTGGHGG